MRLHTQPVGTSTHVQAAPISGPPAPAPIGGTSCGAGRHRMGRKAVAALGHMPGDGVGGSLEGGGGKMPVAYMYR